MVAVGNIRSIRIFLIAFLISIVALLGFHAIYIATTASPILAPSPASASTASTATTALVPVWVTTSIRFTYIDVDVLVSPVGGDVGFEERDASVKIPLWRRCGQDIGLYYIKSVSFYAKSKMPKFCAFVHHLIAMFE